MDSCAKKTDRGLFKGTDEKIDHAKKFLYHHGLAPNIYNLLGLVGAAFVEDFVDVDEALQAEIENIVRNPNFQSGNLGKSERMKFFGDGQKEASMFSFTVLDRRKLQKVAEDARQYCEEVKKERAEKEKLARESKSQSLSQAVGSPSPYAPRKRKLTPSR